MTRIAHHDARTLFERAWSHGMQTGLIDFDRRLSLIQEGARGIRKIANVLGTEHLRGDQERAMRSMLGLVDLHLRRVSGGDVVRAARSIAENGLLFHTRGASRAIKQVLAIEDGRDPDALDEDALQRYEELVVTEWAGYSLDDLLERERNAAAIQARRVAARAIVRALDGDLEGDDFDADSVLLTALLILAYRRDKTWIRDVPTFEKLLVAIRKSPAKLDALPRGIPEAHRAVAEGVWKARAKQIRALVADSAIPIHVLAAGNPEVNPLHGHLELPGDALEDVEAHGAATTAHWQKLTRGTSDESRLLVIMLKGVLGVADKPPFSLRTATRLLATELEARPEERLIEDWLAANVPHQRQADLHELWGAFWDERESLAHGGDSADAVRRFCDEWFPMKAPSRKS